MANEVAVKEPKDCLKGGELEQAQAQSEVLVSGHPFVWVMTFGWAEVGFFVRMIAPHRMLIKHGSFFVNAGKDYGRLAREGADENCQWRYEGEYVEINPLHTLKTLPYNGVVHRGENLPAAAGG